MNKVCLMRLRFERFWVCRAFLKKICGHDRRNRTCAPGWDEVAQLIKVIRLLVIICGCEIDQ